MKKILFCIIIMTIGFLAGVMTAWNYLGKIIEQAQSYSDKHLKLFKLMGLWVNNFQDNKRIEQYLQDRNINKIAIYGMGIAGVTLYRELGNSKIEVCYGIDQAAKVVDGIEVLSLNEQLPDVDAIIVTPVTAFADISINLEQKVKCEIMSLEGILLDM